MTISAAVGVGVICAVCTLLLKELRSPLASFVPLLGGVLLLLSVLTRVTPVLDFAQTLSEALPEGLFASAGKVLAAGILCSLGADICSELGAPSLGAHLTLVGKIEILLLSLPVLKELFSRVEALLS